MNRCLALAFGILILFGGSKVRADGLLYQLPEDGAWVRFELKIIDDNAGARTESVIMRSVGRVPDDEGSRWLEFKVPEEEGTKTIKLLIAERHLKEGESPMDHVTRAWAKRGDDVPVSVLRLRDFWLLVFLAGPLADVQKLDSKVIETPLGPLECAGLSGRAHVREDDGYEENLSYTIRRHEKAPFGVVACNIDCVVSRDGQKQGTTKFELKLIELGKNAVSELRGYD